MRARRVPPAPMRAFWGLAPFWLAMRPLVGVELRENPVAAIPEEKTPALP